MSTQLRKNEISLSLTHNKRFSNRFSFEFFVKNLSPKYRGHHFDFRNQEASPLGAFARLRPSTIQFSFGLSQRKSTVKKIKMNENCLQNFLPQLERFKLYIDICCFIVFPHHFTIFHINHKFESIRVALRSVNRHNCGLLPLFIEYLQAKEKIHEYRMCRGLFQEICNSLQHKIGSPYFLYTFFLTALPIWKVPRLYLEKRSSNSNPFLTTLSPLPKVLRKNFAAKSQHSKISFSGGKFYFRIRLTL